MQSTLTKSAVLLLALSGLCLVGAPHRAVAQTFSNESAWDDGTYFYYKASYTGSYPNFNVFLDTDSNASTGYAFYSIGADYCLENTSLFKSSANGNTWSWTTLSTPVTETVPQAGTIQFSVPLSAIGSPSSAKVMFQVLTSGWAGTSDTTVVTYSRTPSAPTGLAASAGNAQVSLSWMASSGASSYSIYRGTSSGSESTTAIATGIATTGYTNTGLSNGTAYYYKVKAINASGTSGYSNEASATPSASTGASYYVSPSGNDSNSGTISSPWLTPQHAANTVGAGSTVYLRAGTYAPFSVNVSGSSSGGYITFTHYAGETATIDGTNWTANYDQGMIEIQNHNYIKISGLNIQNANTTSSTSGPCGVMVEGTGSYIQILNNQIHNIANTASSNGNAHGILIKGDSASGDIDNVTISGNQVYSMKTGWSENVSMDGDITNFTISNNTVHDNNNIGIDMSGGYGFSPLVDQARNGEVSGNIVYNCTTLNNPYYNVNSCAGLYCDGSTNIVMERNTVHNNDYGVECAAENSGKVTSYITVRSNEIYQNAVSGIGLGGYQASGVGGTSNCTFVNNTLYNNDTNNWWAGEIGIGWRATGNIFDNNIFYAGSSNDVFVKDYATDGASVGTFDYNGYFSLNSNTNAKWQWINQTAWTYTLASWHSLSGQDTHSYWGDPLFASLTSPNFNLSTGSPARNSGNYGLGSSAYGTLDFASNARTISSTIDMGAFEN